MIPKVFDIAQCNAIVGDHANLNIPIVHNFPNSENIENEMFVLCETGLNIPKNNEQFSVDISCNIGVLSDKVSNSVIIVVTCMLAADIHKKENIIHTFLHNQNNPGNKLISFRSSINSTEHRYISGGYYRCRIYVAELGDVDLKNNTVITGPVSFRATSYLIPKTLIVDNKIVNNICDGAGNERIGSFSSNLTRVSPKYVADTKPGRSKSIKSIVMGFGDSSPINVYVRDGAYFLQILAQENRMDNFVFTPGKNIIIKKIVSTVEFIESHYFNIPVNLYIGIFKASNDNSKERYFGLYKKHMIAEIKEGKIRENKSHNRTIDDDIYLNENEDYMYCVFSEYTGQNKHNTLEWIKFCVSFSIVY